MIIFIKSIDEHRKVCYYINKLRENKQNKQVKENRTMKTKLKTFWEEWGINKEEFEMLLGALSVIMFPIELEIILTLF